MDNLITSIKQESAKFVRDEEGAQVVEYALIIAVVSIALVLALQTLAGPAPFAAFVKRVTDCLTLTTCS